mmetsp:Transcript_12295/g.18734  ORF Transcript_12295/g.18734 Transcript_12295/m.18734 type:complete len:113 (-) Transcript_12295:903-1241(-)
MQWLEELHVFADVVQFPFFEKLSDQEADRFDQRECCLVVARDCQWPGAVGVSVSCGSVSHDENVAVAGFLNCYGFQTGDEDFGETVGCEQIHQAMTGIHQATEGILDVLKVM